MLLLKDAFHATGTQRQREPKTSSAAAGDGNSQQECD
jgi:hypothetical protein